MRENADQSNSEYGHFLRSVNFKGIEKENSKANLENIKGDWDTE